MTLIEVMVGLILISTLATTLAFVWKNTEERRILIDQERDINEQAQRIKTFLSSPPICTKLLEGVSHTQEVTSLNDIEGTLKSIEKINAPPDNEPPQNGNSATQLFSLETPYTRITSISLGQDSLATSIDGNFVIKPLTVVFEKINGIQRGESVTRQLAVYVELNSDGSVKECPPNPESLEGIVNICEELGNRGGTGVFEYKYGSVRCIFIDRTQGEYDQPAVMLENLDIDNLYSESGAIFVGKGLTIRDLRESTGLTVENLNVDGEINFDSNTARGLVNPVINKRLLLKEAEAKHLVVKEICVGNECRTKEDLTTITSCPSGQYAYGMDSNGKLLCEDL